MVASGGSGLCSCGRVEAALVQHFLSAGPAYSGSDPLVVLVFLVADIFQSVDVMYVVGFAPAPWRWHSAAAMRVARWGPQCHSRLGHHPC
eukprot:883008-Heterocapsa_arctica.AAC.1